MDDLVRLVEVYEVNLQRLAKYVALLALAAAVILLIGIVVWVVVQSGRPDNGFD